MNFNNPHTSQLNYGINNLNNSISRLQYLISHLATKVHTIEKSINVLSKVLIEQKIIDEVTLNSYYIEDSDTIKSENVTDEKLLENENNSLLITKSNQDISTAQQSPKKIEMTIEKQ